MRCSVIVVSYNTKDILRQCLQHAFASTGITELEVFVVDNASPDNSAEMVRTEFPQANLHAGDWNMGFARANNLAYSKCNGDFIALLNPDAFVEPEAIANAVEFLQNTPSAAACGGLIIDGDGGKAPSARRFPSAYAKFCRMWGLADTFHGSKLFDNHDYRHADLSNPLQVDWVPGTFTVFRRSALDDEQIFDERFFMYYEETDLCMRLIKKGWTIWYTPEAKVVHLGGASARTVKKDFDTSGSQVSGWRLRSEYLYHRKQFGLHSVLANSGIEMFRHIVRIIINSIKRNESAKQKRADSARKLSMCWQALRDTRFGSHSPEAPW